MAQVPLECNHQHQHHDGGFQHFKHIKILGSTLDDLTPQVKGKKEVSLTHKVYVNISPLLGIDIMLISLGATFNDSYVLIKLINYTNRFLVLAIALLSLIRNLLVSQSTHTSQLQWFTLNVQCTFIIASVTIYSRWRDNILALHKQLRAITLKSDSLSHEQCSLRGDKNISINLSNIIRFRLINISFAWSAGYFALSLLYLYLFTVSVIGGEASPNGHLADNHLIAGSRHVSQYTVYLLYCTFVPFVRLNWIVITAGVYIFFSEHLYTVKCLLLKAIIVNYKGHYKGNYKRVKDANSILLSHYKDCLLSHYEMMRLTRHFNSIFNIFPIMWLTYNLLDSLSLLYTCTVCVSTLQEKMNVFAVSETLFTHLTNMLSAMIVLLRVTHLQRKSNYLANQVLLHVHVNAGVKDENDVNHLARSKCTRKAKPSWFKYKSSKHSTHSESTIIHTIQSTNHYTLKLINELTHYCTLSSRYTFITYVSLIFLFIQLSLTLPCYLYLLLSSS